MIATLVVGALVFAGALFLPLATLAEATSTILLTVFVIVNLALIVIKRSTPQAAFRVPVAVPVFGVIAAGLALIANIAGA